MNINFIVCDDDVKTLKKVENIISQTMMDNQLSYKTHLFSDYNNDFLNIVKQQLSNKIYILDIETPSRSGIDIGRIIRDTDVSSIIIFLTSHEELGSMVIRDEIMCLSFINKFDDYEFRLKKAIKKSLEMLNFKNIVSFEENGVIFTICVDDVLYVTRDTVERKSIIKTSYTEFATNKSLVELNKLFGSKFVRTHKSCIVNQDRVVCINKTKKLIKFNTGETIDLLSAKYKKEMKICG